MINLQQISKIYNGGKPNEFVAISEINLEIEGGRVTVLRGPSGSGKTTLLSILGCMARPTSGRISFQGQEITSLPERFLAQIRQQSFGFIFQQLNLIHGMSALENVMLPAYPRGEKYFDIRERGKQLLATFDLTGKEETCVQYLSGGRTQRVAIARALINKPEVIISDEPTAHLDTRLSAEFMEIMARLNQDEGKTILIASHDPIVNDSEAVHNVVDMRDGEIIGTETRQ